MKLQQGTLSSVSPLPTTADAWLDLKRRMTSQGHPDRQEQLRTAYHAAQKHEWDAETACEKIRRKVTSCEQAGNNLPSTLVVERDTLAAASGLAVTQLPFVGELLDMAEGQHRWTFAANAVLGSFARTVLVPAESQEDFRRAIDPRPPQKARLHFAYVDVTSPHEPTDLDPSTLAGKLLIDPATPFGPWLQQQLAQRFSHHCVDSPKQLLDDGIARVTPTGQERHRSRGAHGGRDNVLGFSNEAELARLRAQDKSAQHTLLAARAARESAHQALEQCVSSATVARMMADQEWADLDLVTAAALRDQTQTQVDELRSANAHLADLHDQISQKKQTREDLTRSQGVLQERITTVRGKLEECRTVKDKVLGRQQHLQRILEVSEEQQQDLDTRLDIAAPEHHSYDSVTAALGRVVATLNRELDQARATLDKTRTDAVRTMTSYLTDWPAPDLQASIDGSPEFLDILTELEDQGIEQQRRQWADNVLDWSAQHLHSLHQEFATAQSTIRHKLDPVRQLLRTITYGPTNDRLDVYPHYKPDRDVSTFLSDLRATATNLMPTGHHLTDDEAVADAEQRFTEITTVLDKIRPGAPTRDQLLDVRQHFDFIARSIDPTTGDSIADYASLAGKSGGETQELLAFITGAALRCRLGDEDNNRPTFAPIVLDEAFIKADSQTAPRALAALSKLGFQPIVVTPEGIFSALEPHFASIKVVLKHDHISAIVDLDDLDATQRAHLDHTAQDHR